MSQPSDGEPHTHSRQDPTPESPSKPQPEYLRSSISRHPSSRGADRTPTPEPSPSPASPSCPAQSRRIREPHSASRRTSAGECKEPATVLVTRRPFLEAILCTPNGWLSDAALYRGRTGATLRPTVGTLQGPAAWPHATAPQRGDTSGPQR